MWKKIMSGLLMAVHWLRLRLRQYGDDASQPASDGAKAAASPGKVLVVYFSATGNTKRVAETIANHENATIFEIQPTEPYSDSDLNYRDDNSRVVREHAQPQLRPTYQGDVAIGIPMIRSISAIPCGGSRRRTSSTPSWKATTLTARKLFPSARPCRVLLATAARTWPRLPVPAIGRPASALAAVPVTMTSSIGCSSSKP